MNAIELQQLKDEITEKMVIGLQSQHFGELLEKYDVLDKVKLNFRFTVNVNTDELSDVKEIIEQEFASQTCGFCVPCPSNNTIRGCIGCC